MKLLNPYEIEVIDEMLTKTGIVYSTLGFWKQNRILGISASMCCDANISMTVLKAFDELAKEIKSVSRLE